MMGAAIGGVIGAIVVLLLLIRQKPQTCSACGATLPQLRRPTNLRQLLWGGWTCKCGAELDRAGRQTGV
jgi:hypothetical protein